MVSLRNRIIEHEVLDELPASAAAASLKDLVRINRFLGGHEVLRNVLGSLVPPGEAFQMLDIGAASGDMGGEVRKAYPDARVTSLDYKFDHLERAAPPRVCADAFCLPFLDSSFDYVYCSLFLHHFDNTKVVALLREFARVARRQVIVSDLERSIFPYWFLPATQWIFGWDPVTLHDGPISVAAAFRKEELQALATQAGLRNIRVRAHRPAFRLSMVAAPQ